MITVDAAVARIVAALSPVGTERVAIAEAFGRVLTEDGTALRDQPPAPMSAMDGYAVRAADVGTIPAILSIIAEAPAGRPFEGTVEAGQAVRIFTGGVVPNGADAVVIQEDTDAAGAAVTVKEAAKPNENIRRKGLDFSQGDVLVRAGKRLGARDLAILAAGDLAHLTVRKKPRVALAATGDELARPGEPHGPGGIVASSTYALAAMVKSWGGEPIDLGILPDRPEAFARLAEATRDVDFIITQGGASVGDYDIVQSALAPYGFALDFWKIAMRPGKPLIFGRLRETPLMGLPGNPVSAMVCALLFLKPAIAAMLDTAYAPRLTRARLTAPLKANGPRQDYIRARLSERDGVLFADPFALQDSSMQRVFADSDGLIIRPIRAPAAEAGAEINVLLLDDC